MRQEHVMTLSIGQLAQASNVNIPTIRFYEKIGLLPEPRRAANDRRIYDEAAIRRRAFIRHARQSGFSVEAVRNLLDLSDHPERPCGGANLLATQQLQDVEAKIGQLETPRDELRRMVEAACNGQAADCRVIETLALVAETQLSSLCSLGQDGGRADPSCVSRGDAPDRRLADAKDPRQMADALAGSALLSDE